MAERVDLVDAVNEVVRKALAEAFVSRPAKVISYDEAAQTVDVEIGLSKYLEDEDQTLSLPLAEVRSVPVAFPRGGGFFVSFPIQPDDYVLLVFSDRSLDLWLQNGGSNVDPIDLRQHSVADAVAIPGIYPNPDALTEAHADNMVVGYDGGMQLQIDTSGNAVIAAVGAATQAVALAQAVKDELDAISTAFNSHTHAGVTAGAASTAIPSATYNANFVASSKVSVEE